MASSLFYLRVCQSFCTSSVQVLFGLPLLYYFLLLDLSLQTACYIVICCYSMLLPFTTVNFLFHPLCIVQTVVLCFTGDDAEMLLFISKQVSASVAWQWNEDISEQCVLLLIFRWWLTTRCQMLLLHTTCTWNMFIRSYLLWAQLFQWSQMR